MRINRLSVAAFLLLGTLAPVFVAAPAHAAYPTCNNQVVSFDRVYPGPEEGQTYTLRAGLPSASRDVACQMGPGANSWSVVALQLALNDCFGANLELDGIYGTATYNTVGFLQAVRHLPVDGIYGPVTRNHMEWGYRPPGTGVDEPASQCRLFWLP